MIDPKDKIIKDAQYRKGLSIAFFNATNSAIALLQSSNLIKPIDEDRTEAFIRDWRNWFLEEHKTYYATVIANIGADFDVIKTIEKLKASKTLDELKNNWTSISAKERDNEEVRKVAKELKITLK